MPPFGGRLLRLRKGIGKNETLETRFYRRWIHRQVLYPIFEIHTERRCVGDLRHQGRGRACRPGPPTRRRRAQSLRLDRGTGRKLRRGRGARPQLRQGGGHGRGRRRPRRRSGDSGPDLSSYNRASYYRFVSGDAAGAIEVMKRAIGAGSRSMENVAWCYVDLGNMYFKIGQVGEAERAYLSALRAFPGYYP